MTFPYGVPMTLVKRIKGVPDALGNDTWTTAETPVRGIFNPGGSTESVQGQDQVVMQPTVYLPAGTSLTAVDAVRVAGELFEIDGSPNAWISPFSAWNAGVEVKLKRATG